MLKKTRILLVFLITILMILNCSFNNKPDLLNQENICYTKQSAEFINKETNILTAKNLDFEGNKQFLNHNYKTALSCFKQALEIHEEFPATARTLLVKSLYNIATIYEVREEYDKAEYSYKRVLNILKTTNQTELTNYNEYLGFLAAIRYQKSSESTEKNLKNTIIAFRQLQNPHNIRVGVAEHRLAQIYLESKKYNNSEKSFKNALTITQKTIGTQHPYYAKILHDFCSLLLVTKKKEQAVKILKQTNLIVNNYPKKLHTKLYQNKTVMNTLPEVLLQISNGRGK